MWYVVSAAVNRLYKLTRRLLTSRYHHTLIIIITGELETEAVILLDKKNVVRLFATDVFSAAS